MISALDVALVRPMVAGLAVRPDPTAGTTIAHLLIVRVLRKEIRAFLVVGLLLRLPF